MAGETYAGQEGGQLDEVDIFKVYGRVKSARHKSADPTISLDSQFIDLLHHLVDMERSVLAANILVLEGFDVEFDGKPYEWQPAVFHNPPAGKLNLRSKDGEIKPKYQDGSYRPAEHGELNG